MSTELSKPTTTEYEDGGHYKPKNRLGEHTENVDIQLYCERHASSGLHVIVCAIVDDPEHGAPYESTGRELLHLTVPAFDETPEVKNHWQSWHDITSNGWNDKDDALHHLSLLFHQLVKAAAETGLAIVRGVES